MGNTAASVPSLTFTFAIISRTAGRRTASSVKEARPTPPSIRAAARQYSRLNFPSSPVAGGSPPRSDGLEWLPQGVERRQVGLGAAAHRPQEATRPLDRLCVGAEAAGGEPGGDDAPAGGPA